MGIPNFDFTDGIDGLIAPKKNPLQSVLDILGSKGGQVLTNAVGAGLSAYGQNSQANASRAQNAQEFGAEMAERQLQDDRADALARNHATLDANPLGQSQGFAQKQALLSAILPQARNFSITAGDPAVQAARGHVSGGMQLPAGGLDPAMIQRLFGEAATQSSLAQNDKNLANMNPHAATTDYSTLFGNQPNGAPNAVGAGVDAYKVAEQARQDAERERQREIIRRALEEDIQGSKKSKGSGMGGKLAHAGIGAASGFITGGPIGALLGGLGGLF